MRHGELNESFIDIPMGKRGRARVRAPAVLYHSLRSRKLAADGSIQGYPLSHKERELEQSFAEPSQDGYIWLSLEPYSAHALAIDVKKLDPMNLRYTGQSEGFLIHKGSIPAEAIIKESDELKVNESLDLFALSSEPDKLTGFNSKEDIPKFAWVKYYGNKKEMMKRAHIWAKDPETAYRFVMDYLKKPWPEGEDAIAQDPFCAYSYALEILYDRFPKGEPAIARSMIYGYWYALKVIKGRFPLVEKEMLENYDSSPMYVYAYVRDVFRKPIANYIEARDFLEKIVNIVPKQIDEALNLYQLSSNPEKLKNYADSEEIPSLAWDRYKHDLADLKKREHVWAKDSQTAYMYSLNILNGTRFPAGEPAIAKNTPLSYNYARMLNRPFPLGEKAIAKDAFYSLEYARNVLKGPFPVGEYRIASSPDYAVQYAIGILHGRFPKGERMIAKRPVSAITYCKFILNGRFPEAEERISKEPIPAFTYARDILKGRWPEGESAIASHGWWAYKYAYEVLRGPFPLGEEAIKKDSNARYMYAELLKRHKEGKPIDGERQFSSVEANLDIPSMPNLIEALDLFNLHNDPEKLSKFKNAKEIPEIMWQRLFTQHHEDIHKFFRKHWEGDSTVMQSDKLVDRWKAVKKEISGYEHLWAQEPDIAYQYALFVLGGRFPEGEAIIAKDAHWARLYARNILHRRFPEAEEAILNDTLIDNKNQIHLPGISAYDYLLFLGISLIGEQKNYPDIKNKYDLAKAVLSDMMQRQIEEGLNLFNLHSDPDKLSQIDKQNEIPLILWKKYMSSSKYGPILPELVKREHIWARDAETAYNYAQFTEQRFPAGEPEIAKEAKWALKYAINVLGSEFPAAEDTIASVPGPALNYARYLIQQRWPKGEPAIVSDPETAYLYAYEVIKGPWPEAEPILSKDMNFAFMYATYILKGRFQAGELSILEEPVASLTYVRNVLKRRDIKTADEAQEFLKKLHATNETMNLYSLSSSPEQLRNYDKSETIPGVAWQKYQYNGPELTKRETLWAQDIDTAYKYARYLNKPWPLGEPMIAKDAHHVYWYALRCLDEKRFKLGEPALIKDNRWFATLYCGDILHTNPSEECRKLELRVTHPQEAGRIYLAYLGKQERAEQPLEEMNLFKLHDQPQDLKNFEKQSEVPSLAWDKYQHNRNELNARKHIWAKDPDTALMYAIRLGHRFPEGEKAILTNSYAAHKYSRDILRKRWVEAEPIIATNDLHSKMYLAKWWPDQYNIGLRDITPSCDFDPNCRSPEQLMLLDKYNEAMAKKLKEDVRFDNRTGLGQTPYNADIDYFGTVVNMTPSQFHAVAAHLPREEANSIDFIKGVLKQGKSIANPTLYVYVPDEWRDGDYSGVPTIQMHEGRNRMYVIQDLEGDVPVPVHIFLRSPHKEWRAKHITPELLAALNKQVKKEDTGAVVPGPWFTTNV